MTCNRWAHGKRLTDMTGQRRGTLPAAFLAALFVIALAGCASTATGVPTVTTSDTTTHPTTSPGSGSSSTDQTTVLSSMLDELSPDDDLRINPPPPQNVRAGQLTSSSAELTWDQPPPAVVPHDYSDQVVAYRVYRSDESDAELRPLGMSTELTYLDQTVESGHRYQYAVASIHELNLEGTRSYPTVEITVP